jgi:alanyl-tRNA synthetase
MRPCSAVMNRWVAWTGDGVPQGTPGTDERWMELWNHVMMRYRRHADGSLAGDRRRGPIVPSYQLALSRPISRKT